MMFRRFLAAALAVFVFCAAGPVAQPAKAQMVAGQSASVLMGGKKDVYPGAAVALDFAALRGAKIYKSSGVLTSTLTGLPGLSFTRSTGGYAEQQNGALVWFNSGQPRITDKGLLVEEGRTNLLLQSAGLDTATWSKVSGATVTLVAGAPDGAANFARVVGGGITSSRIQQSVNVSAGAIYSGSIYLAYDSAAASRVAIFDGGVGTQIAAISVVWTGGVPSLSTINGTFAVAPALTQLGSTGIWRLTYGVNSGAFTSLATLLYPDYVAGTGATKFWGAQLELGDISTSYIPTTTVPVARAADDLFLTTSAASLTSYTLALQGTLPQKSGTVTHRFGGLGTAAGDNNNRQHFILASSDFQGSAALGGTTGSYGLTSPVVTSGSRYSVAMRRSGSTFSLAMAGVYSSSTNFTNAGSGTFEGLRIGRDAGSNPLYANGYIERVLLYPTPLSDTQFAAIASAVDPSALRLDFAAGTYKNAAGYVRTNILRMSEEFDDSAWVKLNGGTTVTIAPDAVASPAGSITADKVSEGSTNTGPHDAAQQNPSPNGTYTLSAHFKAAERTFAHIRFTDTATGGWLAVFNLSTGTATLYSQNGASWTGVSASAVLLPNGWVRCWVTATKTAGVNLAVGFGPHSGAASADYAGTVGSGVYVYGAMVELSGSPSTYFRSGFTATSTTTYSSTNPADVGNMTFTRASTGYAEDASGNLVLFGSNVPRITNKGVLIEPAATNLLPYSFNDTPAQIWDTLVSATVGAGVLAPRATGATSTRMTLTAVPGRVQRNISVPNDSLARTFSVDVEKKAVSYEISAGYAGGTGVSRLVRFDGATGNVTAAPSEQYSVVDKGAWWRVSVTVTNNGTGNVTGWTYVGLASGSVGDTVEIALPDYEVGTLATSYKPSRGNTNFTRPADVFFYTGIPDLAAAGTLAGSWIANSSAANLGVASLNDGSSNNRVDLRGHSFKASASIRSGAADQFTPSLIGAVVTAGQVQNAVVAWTANRGAISANSSAVTSTGTLTVPAALSRLHIGLLDTVSNQLISFVQRVTLYPYAANDNELPYRSAGNF